MKTVTCDKCKGPIVTPPEKEFTMRGSLGDNRNVKFTVVTACFEFNMTDKDFCRTCIIEAIKEGARTL